MSDTRPRTAFLRCLVSIAVILILATGFKVVGGFPQDDGGSSSETSAASALPTPKQTPKSTPSATAKGCDPAYQQVMGNHESNRVVGDFATKYAMVTAEANNISKAQIDLLLEESGKNAQVLAIWTHAFGLHDDPNVWANLVDSGCLSSEGIKLHNQLEGALTAKGTLVTEADAPADGYNSGIADGVYGVDASQGVPGDRKAIKISKDGTTVYIMVRCGNVVYPGKPPLPPVPTDNPKCPWNPNLPPDSPDCLQPKVPAQDPGPSGNAPVGEGPNSDPGPGKYIPPQDMVQPSATPYVPPASPAPAPPAPQPSTPSNPTPAPVPTKDPAPTPTPQPSAPPPTDPVGGCVPLPGATDC